MTRNIDKSKKDLEQEIVRLKEELTLYKFKTKSATNNNQLLSTILKADLVYMAWNFNNDLICWPDNTNKILGLDSSDLGESKNNFCSFIHPDDTGIFEKSVSKAISSNSDHVNCEFRLQKPSKEIVWIRFFANISYSENVAYCILTNITKEKTVDFELQDRVKRYELISKGSAGAIWDWDVPNKTVFFSPRWKELRGYKEDEIGNSEKEWSASIHPDDLDRVLGAVNDHFKGKTVFFQEEYRIMCKDGSYKWILDRGIAQRDSTGNVIRMAGSESDITDRKLAADALKKSRARYESLFNDCPVALWEEDFTELYQYLMHLKKSGIADFEQYFNDHPDELQKCAQKVTITNVNKATLHLHEAKSKEELLGNLEAIFTPNSFIAFKKEVVAIANNQTEIQIEGEIKTLTGKSKQIILKLFTQKESNERMTAILATVDITDKKKTEEELQQQNKEYEALAEEYKTQNDDLISAIEQAVRSDKLKSEFLQNLSHEIRTPMNAILGFTSFLNLKSTTSVRRNKYIEIIESSGNQLLRIIDDLLEISALETQHIQVVETRFSLNQIITELFTIFKSQSKDKNISFKLIKPLNDNESYILTDDSKLRKILTNLIENAVKYTVEGFIEVGYKINNNDITIYVKDTGIGIEESRHQNIFERFSQAEHDMSKRIGGLGLGLSIVKENVKLIGGSIELKSKPGKGSTFSVIIPNCRVQAYNSTSETNFVCNQTLNILVVEDEDVNFLYLKTLFEEVAPDYNIIHASNGLEAIHLCKNHNFELVFMDIKMPQMNGYETCEEILKFNSSQKIIAQTAYTSNDDKTKARLAGCIDFMSKPIKIESMQKILDKYIYQL
jgi:PAS domain S-box-containing protein